ncbi:uncharacterized protein LOC126584437 [Malus sylvestris]|uniref:uncharacterized protein LOC126584437 n=1 Tax=Malus sylvestris TaxID=3752 RepID=UPI0021ABDCE6|nr:uncharacterized protein LOC126584437 [Malus sylvestris]
MALKLDISKACDRIEWSFLEHIMQRLGFADEWITWIMQCIMTVSYSFKLNGEPISFVQPKRGIRQGDLLSPFLFVICAEGLSALLDEGESQGRIKGIKDCCELKNVLHTYELASGHAVNLSKSCVSFSANVNEVDAQVLADCLGMNRVNYHDRYLGLSMYTGKSKKQTFAYIKDRLWKKLNGWRGSLLSNAGKEILIKIVAQAVPLYTMQTFLLPKTLCDELNKMVAQFWWGKEVGKRRIHWVSWKKMCKPKSEGGLGFKDLYAFNLALLAKQGWRIIQQLNSLVAHLFKARYFPDMEFLIAPVKSNSSFCWRSITTARVLIQRGARWRVGDGLQIEIWGDSWLPRDNYAKVLSPVPVGVHHNLTVTSLMVETNRLRWNMQVVSQMFFPEEANLIFSIPLSLFNPPDKLIWIKEPQGNFTTKSAYFVARTCSEICGDIPGHSEISTEIKLLWKALWRAKPKPKSLDVQKWRKPDEGWLKSALKVEGISLPLLAETIAAREAALFVQQWKLQKVILEGDALLVIAAIQNDLDVNHGPLGHVLSDIHLLLQPFQQWKAHFVRRDANTVAHWLARRGLTLEQSVSWFEEPPDVIVDLLLEYNLNS